MWAGSARWRRPAQAPALGTTRPGPTPAATPRHSGPAPRPRPRPPCQPASPLGSSGRRVAGARVPVRTEGLPDCGVHTTLRAFLRTLAAPRPRRSSGGAASAVLGPPATPSCRRGGSRGAAPAAYAQRPGRGRRSHDNQTPPRLRDPALPSRACAQDGAPCPRVPRAFWVMEFPGKARLRTRRRGASPLPGLLSTLMKFPGKRRRCVRWEGASAPRASWVM